MIVQKIEAAINGLTPTQRKYKDGLIPYLLECLRGASEARSRFSVAEKQHFVRLCEARELAAAFKSGDEIVLEVIGQITNESFVRFLEQDAAAGYARRVVETARNRAAVERFAHRFAEERGDEVTQIRYGRYIRDRTLVFRDLGYVF
jgi:hypothetical protein